MNHTLLFLGPSDGHEEEREREKSLSPHPPIAMYPPSSLSLSLSRSLALHRHLLLSPSSSSPSSSESSASGDCERECESLQTRVLQTGGRQCERRMKRGRGCWCVLLVGNRRRTVLQNWADEEQNLRGGDAGDGV
ncbi:hypothetical protein ATANTOWER_019933 [Ataeniobius toweri]|uniref:Uncharacterized protein n=1 Tax=Ataeniobius toweri TaxID=208326 RepID=A0ABU7AI35_9TELE|nr:hypothetical protein [Ataeniobius toweri]